jgi:hypothetical protein
MMLGPMDGMQADVRSRMACAQASANLRTTLSTACLWSCDVKLDLHDSRQLQWLQRHFRVS